MASCAYQVLLVGDFLLDAFFDGEEARQPAGSEIEFARVSTYPTAIQFVQFGQWDAVLVAREFDGHTGLEFIQHARLLEAKEPLVLLCETYDDELDYKARKIGAADSAAVQWVNASYLYALLCQRKNSSWQEKTKRRSPPLLKAVQGFLSLF